MNVHSLIAQSKASSDILTIEATVITGFEFLAQDECREKCKPLSMAKAKGRIFFNIPATDFKKVLSLRSVDNILLVTETVKELPFEGNKGKDLEIVKSLVDIVDWESSLSKWAEITGFKGIIYPHKKDSTRYNDGLTEAVGGEEPHRIKISDLKEMTDESKTKDTDLVDKKTLIATGDSSKGIVSKEEVTEMFYDNKTNGSDNSEVENKLDNNKYADSNNEICTAESGVDFQIECDCDELIETNLHASHNQKTHADKLTESETKSDTITKKQNNLNISSSSDLNIEDHHIKSNSDDDILLETNKEVGKKFQTDDNIQHEIDSSLNILSKSDNTKLQDTYIKESVSAGINEEESTEESCPLIAKAEDNCIVSDQESLVKESDASETKTDIETPTVSGVEKNNSLIITKAEDNKDNTTEQDCSRGSGIVEIKESANNLEEEVTSVHKNSSDRPRERKKFGRNKGKPGWRGNQRSNMSKQTKSYVNDGTLRFRATCYRVGEKHSFSSMEAACEFGGTLQDKYGWTVDLTRFDLNVILNIEHRQGYICIALTQESLHRRNITHFSNTTLRATMCYNLFRLAEPVTGEIVIDPLCGGGSIPIEGSLSFPKTYHICGDYNDKAVERTRANIEHINRTNKELKIGAIKWNVKRLPLRAQSIDVLVTDLPFGKRSGSRQDNQRLYGSVLFELAKVVKTGTGRACLLTYDKTSLIRALRSHSIYWREIRQFGVNQGGLFSTVFLLLRKATPIPDTPSVSVPVKIKDNASSVSTEDNILKGEASSTKNDSDLKVETNSVSQSENHSLEDKNISTITPESVIENNSSLKEKEDT